MGYIIKIQSMETYLYTWKPDGQTWGPDREKAFVFAPTELIKAQSIAGPLGGVVLSRSEYFDKAL